MDSDMLIVAPIDDVLYGFSNSSFLAAPETFPPDTFNSGFMVLNPSIKTYKELLRFNEVVGSTEGGDQGVFNNGLCPQWFTVGPNDPSCGRLPWIFNIEVLCLIIYLFSFGLWHVILIGCALHDIFDSSENGFSKRASCYSLCL